MNTDDLIVFQRVAATGNMSEVARQLNLTPQATSAAIARLEAKLHTRLFERSTRAIRLTEDGENLLPFCAKIIDTWHTAVGTFRLNQDVQEGTIHVGVPSDFSRNYLLDIIDEFQQHNPSLIIQLHVTDRLQNFQNEILDIVIRYGELQDSSLIAKKLLSINRVVCASPDYIKKHPEINHPSDLTAHNCITFNRLDTLFSKWTFSKNGKKYDVNVNGTLHANDGDIVRLWALRGRGVIYKSSFDCQSDIKQGNLVQLLKTFTGHDASIYAIYPSHKYLPIRVRIFIDFLALNLERMNID